MQAPGMDQVFLSRRQERSKSATWSGECQAPAAPFAVQTLLDQSSNDDNVPHTEYLGCAYSESPG